MCVFENAVNNLVFMTVHVQPQKGRQLHYTVQVSLVLA